MSRHYKIIVAGYNCLDLIQNCVDSIASQTYTNFDVCLVDDASTDEGQAALVQRLAEENEWKFLLRTENAGALRSQHEGITLLDPQDGDVIVWVDMDDAFASTESLAILDSYYDDDTPMTYGSYQSVPHSETCPQPSRYPPECEAANDYRSLRRWGIRYNHLRTVRWELYKLLDVETDFMFEGKWMHLASDAAVMVPCLEMSGGKYKFIPDVLYSYTSDNPLSEWRKSPDGTNRMHAALAAGKKKEPVNLLNPLETAHAQWVAEGSPLDRNGSVPHDIKMFYVYRTLRDCGLTSFVESGTSHGDGIVAILPYVDHVHSIEAWEEAFIFSSKRFAGEAKVNLHFGDSEKILPEILPELWPSVFWLDAHYSGDGTAQLDKDTPVVAELKAIAASKNRLHAIVIDDARGFGDWKDYPSIEWVENFVAEEMPHHRMFTEGDEIFIVPKSR
jgi:hypothetical protein